MTQTVRGYSEGLPFDLLVDEVECGHLMRHDLVPQVQEAISAGRSNGLSISISSAFRTMAKQQWLYDGFTAGKPGFHPADRPGFSKHQLGECIDLSFRSSEQREEFVALAEAHGFTRPIEPEPWHFFVSHVS